MQPKMSVEDFIELTEILIEGRSVSLNDTRPIYDKYIRRFANMLINRAVAELDQESIDKYVQLLHNQPITKKEAVKVESSEPAKKPYGKMTQEEVMRGFGFPENEIQEMLAQYAKETSGET